MATIIRLEKFGKENYATLIGWIDSAEALMQFGGPLFQFPLTPEQLDVSLSDTNRTVFRIVSNETNTHIGHAEIYASQHSAKIGRILIGDTAYRGKGLCPQIVRLLLDYTFFQLDKPMAELNVFDWNTGAIKCYEKVGFAINPDKILERKINGETWIALNMTIDRLKYESLKAPDLNL